jgi:uncharacterized protein YegP (UPF0339 family)
MIDETNTYRFDPYEDEAGESRWRIKAGNNKIVADSAEGYTEPNDRDEAMARLLDGLRDIVYPKSDFLVIRRDHFDALRRRYGSSDELLRLIEEASL